ncbi:MAG TPA: alpha/beta fold hydrolase [Candidatus Limnocylindria bacterium]|jgi:pimeloyl-ACP methyl ester carboxylesterase/quercetin dioxygenase-like cupin family protein|nr:alpha/beta fold hydrolase [Candidatus Limnocylindria bacterium]
MQIPSFECQRLAVGFTLLIASVALILAHEEEPGVVVKPVLAEKLPDLPGRAVSAVTVSYAPGARSGAHHHAGSVFAYVLTGAIRSENSATGPVKVYQAGESFFEPPGSRHLVSENASQTEPASLLAVFIAPEGVPLTTQEAAAPAVASRSFPADLKGAIHGTVRANGVKLHYVTVGEGEPVVLAPGWPESWVTWRRVIPELVRGGRRVIAFDPRGFGESDKPRAGCDPATVANDLHAFLAILGLTKEGGVDIVAHDIGTWIAFTHAAMFPQDVRRLVLSEASIPGVSPLPGGSPDDETNLRTWHFGFNRLDDLPETLVQGHERAFLAWFFDHKTRHKDAIEPAAFEEYVRLFSDPDTARAGFTYYRDFFSETGIAQGKANAAHGLTMPVLALGGEGGVGDALLKTLQPLGNHVQGGVLPGCGHYLPEECPEELVRLIRAFWQANPVGAR